MSSQAGIPPAGYYWGDIRLLCEIVFFTSCLVPEHLVGWSQAGFMSLAHTDADIDATIAAARDTMSEL